VEVLKRKGIKLVNMSGIHGDPIAEHVMGLIINYSRGLYRLYEYQQEQKWQRINVGQLEDRTMTIVGTGSIGREIARRAKAFKMKTIGVKRTIKNELEFFDRLFTDDDLQRALQEADYVVVTVPLTTETRGMFGEREFEAMKETAFFVNIARGAVVDEQAMIEALKKGIIAGAGLDVFEIEPLPADSPLYRLENVYLTPHISGLHPDYNLKAIRLFVDNLQRYSRGEKLLNLVDYGVGY
jgi:D-2-hydroxyacid dehydrogenase (NADP+)